MAWFGGDKKRGTAADTAEQNVRLFLTRIEETVKRQNKLNDRADGAVTAANRGDHSDESTRLLRQLEAEASANKETFLDLKKAAKSSIEALQDEAAARKATSELEALRDSFRVARDEYKHIGVAAAAGMGDTAALMQGAAPMGAAAGGFGGESKNTRVLDSAQATATEGVGKLQGALADLGEAQQTADGITQTLAADRATIEGINANLDQIDSDLDISQRLITNLLKRLYTDKIIIALTCLIVTAIIGIIIYSSVNPKQDTFNVPDQAKPPVPSEVKQSRLLRGLPGLPAAPQW